MMNKKKYETKSGVKSILFIVEIFFAILLIISFVFGSTYYVDGLLSANCDGITYHYDVATRIRISGAGQIAWKSMHIANTTMTAGDICYIRGSMDTFQVYQIGDIGSDIEGIQPTHSGTDASHRITYATYQKEKVAFRGATRSAKAVYITDKSWIKVTGYDGSTNAINFKFNNFDNGFLWIWANSNLDENGVWAGIGGSYYNEVSHCEFAYDKYRTYKDWQSGHNYSIGDTIVPLAKKNYRIYVVTTGPGTSGNTEPNWDDNGSPTNDNNLVWTRYGGMEYHGSFIEHNACFNWIHHCSFHDFGFYTWSLDGPTLLDIGWDDCGSYKDCFDTTSCNVVENCIFYHGGHQTMGIMNFHNVVRNNIFHNEQWYYYSADGIWHSHRNLMQVGSTVAGYQARHGDNLLEGNRISHGSVPATNQYGSSGVGLNQKNNIYRFNDFYAGDGWAINFTYHTGCEITTNHVYNNTFFAQGYGDTFPSIKYPPHRMSVDRRPILFNPGYNGADWYKYASNALKNNLFWKNWGYDNGLHMMASNQPNQEFYGCSDHTVCGDMIFSHNFNDSGAEVDPKFVSEGSYGNPQVTYRDYAWFWPYKPDGRDITTINTEPNFALKDSSPAIDKGTYLTQAKGSDSNSTTLVLDDVKYFQPGWGNGAGGGANVQADWIAIGTISNIVQISAIDTGTKTITLASPKKWSNGAPVWLYKNSIGDVVLYGSAPDCGAHEVIKPPTQTKMRKVHK
jgi:hypothetical protein